MLDERIKRAAKNRPQKTATLVKAKVSPVRVPISNNDDNDMDDEPYDDEPEEDQIMKEEEDELVYLHY